MPGIGHLVYMNPFLAYWSVTIYKPCFQSVRLLEVPSINLHGGKYSFIAFALCNSLQNFLDCKTCTLLIIDSHENPKVIVLTDNQCRNAL